MSITCQSHDGTARVSIEGEMTIYTAAELGAVLLPLLADMQNNSDDLAIDLSQVTEMDSAGVQLLMLSKRESQRAGKALHLDGHSQAVLETFELCNLAPYFGDPLILAPDE
ncbi:anti-anti-sigma factor [Pseudomonas sp. JUb42]|jgi:anti-anti-sigma factor|uniref:STAS domain-containing protein n=1 Tax=Pseudomonas sp. JUb42 TaxID=2940611 RepID=UPI002168F219|nr:STAS domain-containing protein [Pseudomonas sp. JUb42]MCS3472646.1 anti-anti-sigma factor [Pseudomonas sp. JUb42]